MLVRLLLGLLLTTPCPARAGDWIASYGLEGVRTTVSWTMDPGGQAGLEDLRQRTFLPLGDRVPVAGGPTPIWLRIDITRPAGAAPQDAWLRVRPPHIWELTLFTQEGRAQRTGFGVPSRLRSEPGATPAFRLRLDDTQTRIHLRMVATTAQLIHLSLLSPTALRETESLENWLNGCFLGAILLMIGITLMNWAATRERLHAVSVLYLCACAVFTLFLDGHAVAWIANENPALSAGIATTAGGLMLTGSILFARRLMDIPGRRPLVGRLLGGTALIATAAGLLGLVPDLIHPIVMLLTTMQLLVGLALLGLAGEQAWRLRTPPALLLLAYCIGFSVFDKAPVLTMFGLLPVRAWTIDLYKIGMLVELVAMHLMLMLRVRDQQHRQTASERQAALAGAEARAQRLHLAETGRFLAMFGHEVRTPLAIIDSTTQSLELLNDADRPEIAQRHARIRAAVLRLDRLAGVALMRERVDSGILRMNPEPVHLAPVLDAVLALHARESDEPDLSAARRLSITVAGLPGWLRASVPDDLPELWIDPKLMQLAIGNLMDNACKYADPGSTIRLCVDARAPSPPEAALLRIHLDSQGPALSAGEIDRLFSRYWRRDEHGGVEGAGLGLHQARRIAQLHGGDITALMLPERWIRFTITLPLSATGT